MAELELLQPKWRKWLSGILLGGFILQSIFRLVFFAQLGMTGRFGFSTILVHGLGLLAFTIVVGALLILNRNRPILRGITAFLLAAIGVVLIVYDVAARATLPIIFLVMPFDSILDFYCAQQSLTLCVAENWGAAGWTAAVLVIWTTLIWLCLDQLSAFAAATARVAKRLLGAKLAYASGAIILLVYATGWAAVPSQMQAREPLYRFLMAPRENVGPQHLVWGTKPEFEIAPSADVKPRTLVVITIDSLRQDSVELRPGEPSMMPFLQSLAESGRLHDLGPAASICGYSYCGIVGLQSGRDWAALESGPPILLSDVLMANGYDTYFLLGGRHLSHRNFGNLYGPDVTLLLDDTSPDSNDIADDREQVARLAAMEVADPSRTYISIHLMSVHAGGHRYKPGEKAPSLTDRVIRSLDRNSTTYAQNHEVGVRQADRVLQELFAEMRRKKLLDDALVIITADHGERTDPDSKVGHGEPLDLDVSDIPLLIYDTRDFTWPEQTVSSQIDVAPTLLQSVNIKPPPSFVGEPLQTTLSRKTAPIDGLTTTAFVSTLDNVRLMYRCNLESGQTDLLFRKQPQLTAEQKSRALAQMPSLAAERPLRDGAKLCFRGTD